MFCPQCGQRQNSEELRFCSRCGLRLDFVKAGLGAEDAPLSTDAPIYKREINIGVTLMFLGTLLVTVLQLFLLAIGQRLHLPGAFLIVSLIFLSILFLSRPILQAIYKLLSWDELPKDQSLPRQKGMRFGAMFMFIGTILAELAAFQVPGRPEGEITFYVALATVFALLLVFSDRLMRAAQNLFKDEEAHSANIPSARIQGELLPQTGDVLHAHVLRPTHEPVEVSGRRRFNTGDMEPPSSVTERTTNLLDDEQR